LLLTAGSVPLLRWLPASAQADRNLGITERKPAAAAVDGASLLVAPRRALVIGNSDYGFGPLKNPANDAKAIGEELKRTGFEVVTGLDLPRNQMIEAIRAYGESLTKDKAVGVFYYAGHGLQLAWRNYLVPVDALISKVDDIQARCVDVNAVIEGISKAANPMNVVILDACRENPFPGVKLEGKGLSQLDAPQATLLAYATAPGNLASDGEGANGLYTENLLREMKVPEAKIEDVFKRVRLAVRRKSQGQQLPWESTSLEDDFWFIPPKELQKAASADAARKELERRQQQERSDRAYEEELAFWNKVRTSGAPGPIEEYLKRYPSGRFAEIAQAQLDVILAREGEKKIEAASSSQNPYSQGAASISTKYKVGDSYTYNALDPISKVAYSTRTETVTAVTEREIFYNNGEIITDLLGNPVKARGFEYSPVQLMALEYKVGRRWSTRYTVLNPQFGLSGVTLDFRIVGKERITVPAGTFDCYRMEGQGASQGRNTVTLYRTIWMCPERVRRPIANQLFRSRGDSDRVELASFRES